MNSWHEDCYILGMAIELAGTFREIEMHYEINVVKDGKHFFATHERSLRSAEEAHLTVQIFRGKFPENEGYAITMRRVEIIAYPITISI